MNTPKTSFEKALRIAEENGLIGKEGSSMASPNISIVLAAPDVSLSGHISGGSVYNPSVENVFSSIPGAGSFDQGRYITVNAVTPYLQAKALEQSGSVTKEEAANIFAASLLHNIAHEMLHPMGLVHGGQSQPGLVVDINEGKYTKYQQELLQAIVEDTAGRAEETYLAVGFSSATGTFPVQYLSAIAQAYDADGLEKFAKTYLEGYDEWLVTEVAKDPNGGARRASELRANRQSSRSNSGNGELGIYRRGVIEPFRRSFASRRAAASRAGVSAGQQGAAGGEPRGAAATVVEPAKPAQPAPPAPPARPTSVARKDIEKADAIGSLLAEAQVDFNDLSEGFDYVSENENSRLLQTWTEDELASKLFDRAFASLENQDNANFNKYKRSILKAKFDIISSEDWKSVYEMLEDDDQPIGPEPEVDLARPEQPSSEIVSASGDVFSAVRSSLIDSAKDIYDSLDENYIDSLTENGELDSYLYDRVVSEQFPEPPGSDELAKLKARFTDPDVKQEIINSEEWSETIYGTTIDTDVTDLDALAEQYPGAFAPISPEDPLNAIVLGEEVEPDTSQSTIGLRDATEAETREYVDYIYSRGLATEPAESELKPLPKYIEADNVDIEISVVESDDEDPFEVFSITIKDPDGQTIDSIVALTKILENEIRGFKLQSRVINPRQNPQSIRFRIYADNLREENGNISPAQLLEKIQVIVSPESFSAEKEAKINDDRSIIAKVRAKIVDDPEFKSNPDRALNTFNTLIEKIASDIALEGYIGIKQFIELYNDALKEWTKTVRGKVALVASLEDRSRLSSLIRIVENLDYREIEAIAARSLFNVERKARSFEEAVREVGGIDVQEKKQKSDIIVQDILQEIEKLKKVIAARRNRGLDSDLSTKKILVLQEKLRRVMSANAENIDDQLNLDLPKAIRENFSLRRKIIKGAKINFTSEFWDSLRRSASKQSGVNASIPREYLAIKRSGVVGTISDIGLDGVFIIFEVPVETIKSAYGNIESEIVPKVNEIIRVKIPATKAGVAVLQRGIITSSPIANLNEDLVIGDADPRSRDYGIAGLNKAEIGLSAEEKYTVASGSIIGIYPNVAAGQDTSAYRLEKTKKVFQILRETMVASSTGGFKDIALIRAAQKRVKDFIDTVIKSPNDYFGGIISEAFSDAARRIKTQAPTAAQRKLILDYTGTIFYDNNGSILINYAGKTYKYADDGSFKVAEKFIESDKSADAFPIEGALLYSLIRNKIAKHPELLAMQYAQTFSGKKFEDLKPSEILDSIIKGQKNALS